MGWLVGWGELYPVYFLFFKLCKAPNHIAQRAARECAGIHPIEYAMRTPNITTSMLPLAVECVHMYLGLRMQCNHIAKMVLIG